jgi:hypothetical protein
MGKRDRKEIERAIAHLRIAIQHLEEEAKASESEDKPVLRLIKKTFADLHHK